MRIAIIGLGLIGGSIGLALKQADWQKAEIVGYVRRSELRPMALSSGAVDNVESSLKATVRGADLIIIATPVLTIKDIFSQIAADLPPDSIVTDTASTKVQVMRWAEELLPPRTSFVGGHPMASPRTSFVGGHPMAGKETSGIKAAEADLFHNCVYCLTPATQAKPAAVQTVADMVKALGATSLTISADEHDDLVAGISHLPLLLSIALVSATTQSPSWEQMSRLAASGYRDLTRLASGNPEVNAHICLSNQAPIISWIDKFSEELQRLRKFLANGDSEIEKFLVMASEARRKWLKKRY